MVPLLAVSCGGDEHGTLADPARCHIFFKGSVYVNTKYVDATQSDLLVLGLVTMLLHFLVKLSIYLSIGSLLFVEFCELSSVNSCLFYLVNIVFSFT